MIVRDGLGLVCAEHGRIVLGGHDVEDQERRAMDHLRDEHPRFLAGLPDIMRVPKGER